MADKNWLDRLPIIGTARENKRLKEALNQKYYSSFSTTGDIFGDRLEGAGLSSLFMETLQAGYSGKNYNANPRAMLATYRAMLYTFPVFLSAISIRKKAMGEPILVSDDKGMQKDLEWLSENLPISNWKNPYKMQRGLCSLKDRLYTAALVNGTAFCQVKRDESMSPLSVELFRSEWFDVCKGMTHITEFYFNSVEGRIYLEPDGDFQIYSQTVGDWDWGIPLAYGADYFAWAALRMIESQLSFMGRIGNPSAFFILSANPVDKATGVVHDRILELLQDKVTKMKDAIKAGMKHTINTGRPFDYFDFIPTDGKLETFTFGQGVTGAANVREILEMFTDELILKTETPAFLFNRTSAAGIGSELYREQSAQFQALIKGDREGIEPHLMQPAVAWMLANRTSPKSMKTLRLEWDAPNATDLKAEADTKLVSAQATGQQLMNIADIVNNTGGGRSKLLLQYLEEIGWDEAIAAELDIEPPADPAPGRAV